MSTTTSGKTSQRNLLIPQQSPLNFLTNAEKRPRFLLQWVRGRAGEVTARGAPGHFLIEI